MTTRNLNNDLPPGTFSANGDYTFTIPRPEETFADYVYKPEDEEKYLTIRLPWITRLKLTGRKLLIYSIIMGFAQAGCECYASVAYFARWCSCTERHAITLLHQLRDEGYITITARRNPKNGAQMTNFYAPTKIEGPVHRQGTSPESGTRTQNAQEGGMSEAKAQPAPSPTANEFGPSTAPAQDKGQPQEAEASPPPPKLERRSAGGGPEDPRVRELIDSYPKKSAYAEVEGAWRKLIDHGVSPEEVEPAVAEYRASTRDSSGNECSPRYLKPLPKLLDPDNPTGIMEYVSALRSRARSGKAKQRRKLSVIPFAAQADSPACWYGRASALPTDGTSTGLGEYLDLPPDATKAEALSFWEKRVAEIDANISN